MYLKVLGIDPSSLYQEMSYRYFELGKNADPEREDSLQFKNAFTVHPVSDPNLMYRLHKRFSQIELELTYLQIRQLQVCWASLLFIAKMYCLFVSPPHPHFLEPGKNLQTDALFKHKCILGFVLYSRLGAAVGTLFCNHH